MLVGFPSQKGVGLGFWRGRRGEAPAGREAAHWPGASSNRTHWVPPAVAAAVFVRQLRGPHLSTCVRRQLDLLADDN